MESLPREVRDKVYRLCLSSKQHQLVEQPLPDGGIESPLDKDGIVKAEFQYFAPTSLLLVCRRFHDECEKIAFEEMELRIILVHDRPRAPTRGLSALFGIPKTSLERIQKLSLFMMELGRSYAGQQSPDPNDRYAAFRMLCSLVLTNTDTDWPQQTLQTYQTDSWRRCQL